jgi:hypothetical protein
MKISAASILFLLSSSLPLGLAVKTTLTKKVRGLQKGGGKSGKSKKGGAGGGCTGGDVGVNVFHLGCGDAEGILNNIARPTSGTTTQTISTRCGNPFDPTPETWVVGTSDVGCANDSVSDCTISGNFVKCQVSVGALDGGSCVSKTVNARLHVLCC